MRVTVVLFVTGYVCFRSLVSREVFSMSHHIRQVSHLLEADALEGETQGVHVLLTSLCALFVAAPLMLGCVALLG